MRTTRTTPLAPFFSILAILSFKKKSKGGGLGGLSSTENTDLVGEGFSPNGPDGGLVNLIRSDDKSDPKEILNDGTPPAGGAAADGKRIQEIEASVNDLKKHAEATDLNSRAARGEIENVKNELSQINDSIKNLLNVYEAVSRQYNPFVEDDVRPLPKVQGSGSALPAGAAQADRHIPAKPLPPAGLGAELEEKEIFDGPLDRIVRPDDAEGPEEFLQENGEAGTWKAPGPPAAEAAYRAAPPPRKISFEEAYALEQVHKLVDHQMSKICKIRLVGEELDEQDIKTLDIWISEFRRLGGC